MDRGSHPEISCCPAQDGVNGEPLGVFRPWLRSVVYARLGTWEGVEDVLQEVALAAVKSPPRPPEKVEPWLRRVAIRQALLYKRRVGRQRRREEAAGSQAVNTDGNGRFIHPDPLEWLASQEQAALVHEAIRRLTSVDAELLLLKYGQDWSYEQIARHLGVSVAVVQSRLHRARDRLRRLLCQLSRRKSLPPD